MNLLYTSLKISHTYRVRLEKYGALGNGLNAHIFCNVVTATKLVQMNYNKMQVKKKRKKRHTQSMMLLGKHLTAFSLPTLVKVNNSLKQTSRMAFILM